MASYCTIDNVKDRLGITGSGSDSVLTELVESASMWVDDWCRLPEDAFAATATATRKYGPGNVYSDGVLELDAPILSVSSIQDAVGSVSSSDYLLMPLNGEYYDSIRRVTGAWSVSWSDLVSVSGVWGVSNAPPKPVVEATAMLSAWLYKRYEGGLENRVASIDLGTIDYTDSIPKQVMDFLSPYRRAL